MSQYLIIIDPSISTMEPTSAIVYVKSGEMGLKRIASRTCPKGLNLNEQVQWALHLKRNEFADSDFFIEINGIGEAFREKFCMLYHQALEADREQRS